MVGFYAFVLWRGGNKMPIYDVADSDIARLSFFRKALVTGPQDIANNIHYLDAAFLAEVAAFYERYNAEYEALSAALGTRVREVAEGNAALEVLKKHVSHLMDTIHKRVDRLGLDSGVLLFYQMTQEGVRPHPTAQEDWVRLAQSLVHGDAAAVAAGYAPVVEPTAVELQTVLTIYVQKLADATAADRAYDVLQAKVAAQRPQADAYIQEIFDRVTFGTRQMDKPSQRRILRSYGARYRYLAKETRDADDPAISE